MLKTISGTFASKFLLALLNFVTIILSTRLLGAEGRGEISFFITNMSLVLLFTGLLGGASLVYLAPRHNFFRFLIPSYSWASVLTIGFCCFLYLTNQLAQRDFYFLFFSILFNSWKSTNMMILLGKEKMKAFNWLALTHSVLLIGFFLGFIFFTDVLSVAYFYWAIVLSNLIIWLWSLRLLFSLGEKMLLITDRYLIKKLFTDGGIAQLANIIQFANYRISYYYLMNMQGEGVAELGRYSIAVSVAESVWIIGQSLATVQFSKLSNVDDPALRKKISIRMFRFNFLLNIVAISILLLLPAGLYSLVFGGEEFRMVSNYIKWLAPGILALGISTSMAAYFSGKGRYWPNVISSTLGALVTFTTCSFFMDDLGVLAAALGASLSYITIFIYFLIAFMKAEKLSLSIILAGIYDLKLYYRWLKGGLYRWNNR